MVFSSLTFLFVFLPIFLIIYYISPEKIKNFILLIFSLLFYSWGEPVYIFLLIFSSLLNYIAGIIIDKNKNDKFKKKMILILCIIINLGTLCFFKYTNFIIDNLNLLNLNIKSLNILLPLGISFFTFQTMSYSIDVYCERVKVSHNFLNFLTYVSMFPQLIAGPIVRYQDVINELEDRNINFKYFSSGFFIFLNGLFKKVLIANNVGYLFSIITSDITNISLLTAWLGIIAFSLQIYFDFSGYSTMAIGMGKMLGFNYPNNFNYPYIADSITDFWHRWHITLSSWFKDYVYIPLGGNRCSKAKNIRNILIVWMLTGLWHGASWNYILWGLYFGIILIIEKNLFKSVLKKIHPILKHIYAIILILIGWLIFSFEDINLLFKYFLKMFNNKIIIDNEFIFYLKNYFIFIVSGIIFSIPIIKVFKLNKFIKVLVAIIYILLFILTIALLVGDSYNPFLYFRF